jgi:outer membrane protein assembly factor BamB
VSGNLVRALVPRITRYVVLGIALILAAATLSVMPASRASAASTPYVQGRNTQVTSGTTASLAFSKANTAGNLIVVYVIWDNPGTVKVSDTKGNTYQAATTRQTFGNNWSAQVFYASNILGGSNTVKATFSNAINSFGIVYLHEYSGLATVSPVDVSASAAGTSASMSSGAVTTTQANDLLFAAGASDITVSHGTGFTARLTGFGNLTEDRTVTTTGSYAGTASQSGTTWAMQLVAFRFASGAPGPAAKLAFVTGPSNTVAGNPITPAVTVAVEDASGNIETSDNATQVSLAIGTNPAGGNLSGGSAVTVASGIATFSGVSINAPGTGYTLKASSTPSYTAATSAAFNITGVGPPAKLAFVKGPSNAAAGNAISPAVTVAVEDANGNIETSDNATQVSLVIGTNPAGGNLSGGAAVTVASGIATFSGLSINAVGTGYTLKASSTPSYAAATSAAFNITTGAPAKLAFVKGPSNAAAGNAISPAVTVAVEDANGNIETSDNATQVSLAIGTNPAGGTLSGGAAVTVASGIATFSGLSIDTAGTGYTLTASSTPSYTAATSAAFNITGVGPPAKLAFVQGPSNAATGKAITPVVTVAVEDANGNVETSDNATQVSLAIGTNPAGGTLSGGAAVTVASGIATFSGLSIDTAGTGYTLTASSTPSYTAATSAAFNITTGTPSSGWTTYLQGNDRTGFAAGESGLNPASAPNLRLAWQASDAGPNHGVFSQPVVSNGLVYWGSFDGYERATDTSGNLVWKTNLGTTSPPGCTDPSEAGVVSTPTITTDVPVGGATSVLYVGGGNSKMYALNAATGAVLWSYDVGGNPNTFIWSSPTVFGNSVYIGVASFGDCPLVQGRLLQLNRVTGALQNTFNVVPNGCTGGGIWGSPTIDAAAGTIYFDTGNGGDCGSSEPLAPALVEVNASNLSLVGSWAVPPAQQAEDSDFGSTPTLFKGVIGGQSQPLVGVINKNGVFYTFKRDALSSGPVWSTRIAGGGGNPTTGAGDIAPAAFDGTTLYVGGDATSSCAGSVNALNPSTGAFIWQHCFSDGPVLGAVTVSSGGVVAVGEGSTIAVVSAATGASLFTYTDTGVGPFWGAPSIAGGTLYEGDMAGNLYALTTNGTPAAQFVQVNSATPQTNQSTVTVPYTKAQGSGDLNAIAIGFTDTTSTITSVTDSAGNVYQLAAPLTSGSGMSQAIYYAKNIKPSAAGANVVTVQFSAAVPFADVRVAEYSGLDPVNPLDTSASAAGSGTAASSGNLTTSAASEVIFGAGYTSSLFTGGTNGFTSRIITPVDQDIAGDEFVGAPGTYAATAGVADKTGVWIMQAVAFRAA